ncbi:MAG: hypothetical protein ACXW03_01605 [Methylobacter sp.]
MPQIYSYTKKINNINSYLLRLPENAETLSPIGTELATIDGITYVSLPDGAVLPAGQPAEIAASIQTVTLTDAQKTAIKAVSPHVALINARVIERVRDKYSIEDELKFARIGIGAALGLYAFQPGERAEMTAFGDLVQQWRTWGRNEKTKLGL